MNIMIPDILTPDQAAAYLQVNRQTIYRYIRDGKLVASRLSRSYRIPRRSLDLLLMANRTRSDITLREYSQAEIARFFALDALGDEEGSEVSRWSSVPETAGAHDG